MDIYPTHCLDEDADKPEIVLVPVLGRTFIFTCLADMITSPPISLPTTSY